MCGLVGIVTPLGHRPSVPEAALAVMRDRLAHRGPDDAGLWATDHAALAHRRLSVIDPTPAGHQPFVSPDERFVLVYNGELYNDDELRRDLARLGVAFRTRCDTETLLHALAAWGPAAAGRLRGMYAFALLDRRDHTLTLARDPLGIKPLLVHHRSVGDHAELTFASEPAALLAHPHITPRPDAVTVSAYLTTLRPTLGGRTLFEGVHTLLPGEWRCYDLSRPNLPFSSTHTPIPALPPRPDATIAPDDAATRAAVEDAVRAHLRTDVPMCALLSGGLDSTIIASIARREVGELRTYAAGAETDSDTDDLAAADRIARALGTRHTRVPITRALFAQRWPELIARTGLPLSTPNTVAIHEVARALHADGHTVALTGEGADELFGGYAPALDLAALHESVLGPRPSPGRFHIESNGWVPLSAKADLLQPAAFEAAAADEHLLAHYESEFAALARTAPTDSPLQAHLRFHRRMNLPNLLDRLDLATMLESVEGRTPLADARIAAFAESLPMADKYARPHAGGPSSTKIALRRAFAGRIPREAIDRPKASFPLPFDAWLPDHAAALTRSAWAQSTFTEAALATVAADPARAWNLAWPMLNLTLWAERWWG